jgi:uncharacterized protein (DUF736 family)
VQQSQCCCYPGNTEVQTETRSQDGKIEVFIQGLCAELGIAFHPQTNGADYKFLTDNGCEAGAAWKKASKDGSPYLLMKLDSLFLLAPINRAMFSNEDRSRSLVWRRRLENDRERFG